MSTLLDSLLNIGQANQTQQSTNAPAFQSIPLPTQKPVNNLNALEQKLVQAKQRSEQRLIDKAQGASTEAGEFARIQKLQDNNPFADLGTDSDTVRGITGGLQRGVGAVSEGAGFATEQLFGTNPISGALESAGQSLQDSGQEALDSRSRLTQNRIEDSRISGDLFDPSTWDFGDDPSIAGLFHTVLPSIAEMAPQFAAMVVKGGPGIALSIGTGVLQAGIHEGNHQYDRLTGMSESELFNNSEAYRRLRADNPDMTHNQAAHEVAEAGKAASFAASGAVGGLGGALTRFIWQGPALVGRTARQTARGNSTGAQAIENAAQASRRAPTSSIAVGATTRTGVSGVEEGAQELAEGVVGTAATNFVAGTDFSITEGSLENAILGALVGGPIGTVAGAKDAVRQKLRNNAETSAQERAQTNAEVRTRVAEIEEQINQGNIETVISNGQYDSTEIAQVLTSRATDKNASAEERAEAQKGIAELGVDAQYILDEQQEILDKGVDVYYDELNAESENIIARFNAKLEEEGLSDKKVQAIQSAIAAREQSIVLNEQKRIEDSKLTDKQRKARIKQQEETLGFLNSSAVVTEQSITSTDSSPEEVQQTVDTAIDSSASVEAQKQSANTIAHWAITQPNRVSDEQINTVFSQGINNGNLDPETQAALENLINIRNQAAANQDLAEVKNNGSKRNKKQGFSGLNTYVRNVNRALTANNTIAAKKEVQKLAEFAAFADERAAKAREAYSLGQSTGKQHKLVRDRTKPAGQQFSVVQHRRSLALSSSDITIPKSSSFPANAEAEAQFIRSHLDALNFLVGNTDSIIPSGRGTGSSSTGSNSGSSTGSSTGTVTDPSGVEIPANLQPHPDDPKSVADAKRIEREKIIAKAKPVIPDNLKPHPNDPKSVADAKKIERDKIIAAFYKNRGKGKGKGKGKAGKESTPSKPKKYANESVAKKGTVPFGKHKGKTAKQYIELVGANQALTDAYAVMGEAQLPDQLTYDEKHIPVAQAFVKAVAEEIFHEKDMQPVRDLIAMINTKSGADYKKLADWAQNHGGEIIGSLMNAIKKTDSFANAKPVTFALGVVDSIDRLSLADRTAGYNKTTDQMFITPKRLSTESASNVILRSVEDISHEILHPLTEESLTRKEFKNEVNRLKRLIRNHDFESINENDKALIDYATSLEFELIPTSIASFRLRHILSQIPDPVKKKSSVLKSLRDAIVNQIKTVFGSTIPEDNTVLDSLIDLVDSAIKLDSKKGKAERLKRRAKRLENVVTKKTNAPDQNLIELQSELAAIVQYLNASDDQRKELLQGDFDQRLIEFYTESEYYGHNGFDDYLEARRKELVDNNIVPTGAPPRGPKPVKAKATKGINDGVEGKSTTDDDQNDDDDDEKPSPYTVPEIFTPTSEMSLEELQSELAELDTLISNLPNVPKELINRVDELKNAIKKLTKASVKPHGIKLSGKSKYLEKDQAKADKATKFIGQGKARTSTAAYAKDFGDLANSGKYTANDKVFISVNGAVKDRLKFDQAELQKALNAKATIITDVEADRKRKYNIGEREVAQYLIDNKYQESSPGIWTPIKNDSGKGSGKGSGTQESDLEFELRHAARVEAENEVKKGNVDFFEYQSDGEQRTNTGALLESEAHTLNLMNVLWESKHNTPMSNSNNFIDEVFLNENYADLYRLSSYLKRPEKAIEKFTKIGNPDAYRRMLRKYHDKWVNDLQQNTKLRKKGFRFFDYLSYFATDGVLDKNVTSAIAVATFNWFNANGHSLWINDTEQMMKSVLGLNENEELTPELALIASDLGSREKFIQNELGQHIAAVMGLRLKDTAPESERARFYGNIGGHALALLLNDKLLQRNTYSGLDIVPDGMALSNKLIQLGQHPTEKQLASPAALKSKLATTDLTSAERERFFTHSQTTHTFIRSNRRPQADIKKAYNKLAKEKPVIEEKSLSQKAFANVVKSSKKLNSVEKQRLITNYTQIKINGVDANIPSKELDILKVATRGSVPFMDELLNKNSTRKLPTTDKTQAGFKNTVRNNSTIPIPESLIKTADIASKNAYTISHSMLSTDIENEGFLTRLMNVHDNALARISGMTANGSTFAKANAVTKQAQIDMHLRYQETLIEHINDVQEGDVDTFFYDTYDIWSNDRLGNASQGFNWMSSKLHRGVITRPEWEFDVDPNAGPDDVNLRIFKTAVMFNLGFSTDKENAQKAIDQFDEWLKKPDVVRGLELTREMFNDPKAQMTEEQAEEFLTLVDGHNIASSTVATGEGMHYIKALENIVKYENGEPFTTDITVEVDGRASGASITTMSYGMVPETNALFKDWNNEMMLMTGVIPVGYDYESAAEAIEDIKDDLYKHVAKSAYDILDNMGKEKKEAAEKYNKPWILWQHKQRVEFIKQTLGNPKDENDNITGQARNNVKEAVTAQVFGAGNQSLKNTLGAVAIQAFYEKLIDLHDAGDVKGAHAYIKTVNKLMYVKDNPDGFKISKIESGDYTNVVLNKTQEALLRNAAEQTIGSATASAVKNIFETSREVNAQIVKVTSMMQKLYKAAFNAESRRVLNEQNEQAIEAGDEIYRPTLVSKEVNKKTGEAVKQGVTYQPSLSAEQKDAIHAKLINIYPMIHSPASKEEGNLSKGMSSFASGGSKPLNENDALTGKPNSGIGENRNVSVQARANTTFTYDSATSENNVEKVYITRGVELDYQEEGIGSGSKPAHSVDAATSHKSAPHLGVLGIHDGFVGGAKLISEEVGRELNKNWVETIGNYSGSVEAAKSMSAAFQAFNAVKDNYLDDEVFMDDVYAAMPMDTVEDPVTGKPIKDKNKKIILEPSDKSPFEELDVLINLAQNAKKGSLNALSRTKLVDQYSYPGSSYPLTDEQRAAYAQAAEDTDVRAEVLEPLNGDHELKYQLSQPNWMDLKAPIVRANGYRARYTEIYDITEQDLDTSVSDDREYEYDDEFDEDSDTLFSPGIRSNSTGPLSFSTTDVFDALNANNDVSLEESVRLKELLSTMVNKLYGGYGAIRALTTDEIGSSVEQLAARHTVENIGPFSSNLNRVGITLNRTQSFVAEQIELSVQESLASKTLVDNALVRLFDDAKKNFNPNGREFFNGTDDQWSALHRNEKAKAQRAYDLIFTTRQDNARGLKNTRSDQLSRFTALALVYPPLRSQLDQMQLNQNTVSQATSDEKMGARLSRWFDENMRRLSNNVAGADKANNSTEQLDILAKKLVLNEHRRRLELNREINPQIQALDSKVNDLVEAGVDKIKETSGKARRVKINPDKKEDSLENITRRVVRTLGTVVDVTIDDRLDSTVAALELWRASVNKNRSQTILQGIFREVRGETEETRVFYEIQQQAKQVEQERKKLKETIQENTLKLFKDSESLTNAEKHAITQLYLRTDVSSLLDHGYKMKQIHDMVVNTELRTERINTLEKEVLKLSQGKNIVVDARELGYFMASGNNVSEMLHQNVDQIVRRNAFKTHHIIEEREIDEITSVYPARNAQGEALFAQIDELTTLWAIEQTSFVHKNNAQRVINQERTRKEADALAYITKLHKRTIDDSRKELFEGQTHQTIKGYVRESYTPHNTYKIADTNEGQRLLANGYVYYGPVQSSELQIDAYKPVNKFVTGSNTQFNTYPSNTKIKEQGIYILKGVGLADYTTGAIINNQFSSKGVKDWSTFTFESISDDKRIVYKSKKQSIDHMTKVREKRKRARIAKINLDTYRPMNTNTRQLVPLFGRTGAPIDYRFMANNTLRDEAMERDNRPEAVIAQTVANSYSKKESIPQNEKVIEQLKEFYDNDASINADRYIEISANSPEERYREIFASLPKPARIKLREVWGEDAMYVRKDVVDVVLGYRNLTTDKVLHAAKKQIDNHFESDIAASLLNEKNIIRIRRGHDIATAIMRTYKDFIVVRNFTTLIDNIKSNAMLLFMYGVPLKDIAQSHRRAIEGLKQYQKDQTELIILQTDSKTKQKRQHQRKTKERMAQLEKSMARNPVKTLIDAGMFQTILDDVDLDKENALHQSDFELFIEKSMNKLPEPVLNAGKVAFVAQDTWTHKMLSQTTAMSDFVARFVLHEHLVKKNNKTNNTDKLSDSAIMGEVREAFVNYDAPSHRALEYMNQIGLMMFTKYFLRTQKIIFRNIKKRPTRAMTAYLGERYIDGVESVLSQNALSNVGNPLRLGPLDSPGALDEPVFIKLLLGLID